MARLIIQLKGKKAKYELTGVAAVLGRDSGNEVYIPDTNCSRQHSQIDCLSDGGYRIVDLNSRNGTSVNDHLCLAQNLFAGDRIKIGAAVILFEDEETSRPKGQRPFLLVQEPGKPECLFELDDEVLSVGKHECNRLRLQSSAVSNRHGEFFFEDDELRYRDLGSTNGTLLDDDLIDESLVPEGATLEVGDVEFSFHWANDPGDIFASRNDAENEALQRLSAEESSPNQETEQSFFGRFPFKARIGGGVAVALILVIAIVLIFSSGGKEEPLVIRLPNGSFEEIVDGKPVGWTYQPSEHLEVSIDEREEGKGKSLLLKQKSDAPIDLETTVYNERDFTTMPKSMQLTAHIRRQFPGGFAGFRFQWRKQDVPHLNSFEYRSGGKQKPWHKVQLSVTPPPWADTMRLGCVAYGARSMTWFDDISLDPSEGKLDKIDFDNRSLVFDSTGRMTLMADGYPLFWEGQLSAGSGKSSTGQHILEMEEPALLVGDSYSLDGYCSDFASGQKLNIALRANREGSALHYAATVTGQALEKSEWLELRLTVPSDINKKIGPMFVDEEGGYKEVNLPIPAQNIKTLVWGERDERIVFSFEKPVQLRAGGLGKNWLFAMRRVPTPRETEFKFSILLKAAISGEEYEQLLVTLRESESAGRYPDVLRLYQELKQGRPFDPETQSLADREIKRLNKMREQIEKETNEAIKQAEGVKLLSEIKYANRIFADFMAWIPEAEQEKHAETRDRLKKLMEEGEKIVQEKDAREILERGKTLKEAGKDLLANKCFEYLIEHYSETKYAEEASLLKVE
ncbi:MAG: FHA domain-containing protein [Planctomycetota bacterium]|nr:FHA domain-containing protein [Planctomycetota bacterium]MDA1137073.1 FHA domain-containing protein [Planctomycetota bacterium]